MKTGAVALATLAWLCLHVATALAHPLDPALLELREQRNAPMEVRFQAPLPVLLQPVLPERCPRARRATVSPGSCPGTARARSPSPPGGGP